MQNDSLSAILYSVFYFIFDEYSIDRVYLLIAYFAF